MAVILELDVQKVNLCMMVSCPQTFRHVIYIELPLVSATYLLLLLYNRVHKMDL